MNDNADLRIEYIEARRVLLDAVVLIGAQAIYLRTEGRLPTYQPFTTDADLVIDPAQLVDVRCRPDQGGRHSTTVMARSVISTSKRN